jgi:transportin-3
MVRLYNSHHHNCFFYLASILVDEYGSENDCIGGLISMLEALLPRAFQLLQEPQGFCHNPDTVDDLFRLFARFLQRNPASFLLSPALPAVFDCAMQAAALDHRDANASVMQFLSELIHTTRTREVSRNVK